MIDTLPKPPNEIKDIALIVNALYTLKILEEEQGKEYVFEYIQQPMVGGTCRPAPVDLPSERGSRVLGRYDKKYFENRLEELQEENKVVH